MYPKNRMPMYEGDSFIHANPIQEPAENSSVQVPNPDSESRVNPGPDLSRATRSLLHKLAVWIGTAVRHPQGKALKN
jgi:hypothetical protein